MADRLARFAEHVGEHEFDLFTARKEMFSVRAGQRGKQTIDVRSVHSRGLESPVVLGLRPTGGAGKVDDAILISAGVGGMKGVSDPIHNILVRRAI